MQKGFSLVELSIVLVILGLLTGGILTGQNLIRAAELRSVVTQSQAFQTAAMSFRDKYFYFPGDMPNATDFWGAMTNCGVASPSGSGTQTCNGNGDGIIDVASAASRTAEAFGFWQQLANAGMIEGTYTGISGSGHINDADGNLNAPAGKFGSAVWHIQKWDNTSGSSCCAYAYDFGNSLFFGADSNAYPNNPLLTTEEAWNIDTKIDDGKAGQGSIIAMTRFSGTTLRCTLASSNTDYDADYDLSASGAQCGIFFRRWLP